MSSRSGLSVRGGLVALTMLIITACSLQTEPVPAGPIQMGPTGGEMSELDLVPPTVPDATNGQQIYAENCASCHGPAGAGDGELVPELIDQGANIPNLTDPDLAQARTPRFWYQIVTNGNIGNLMPPWRNALTDEQRWDVVYYLYSFSRPPEALTEGQLLYEELFAEEYGPAGGEAGFTDLEQMSALNIADIRDEFVTDEGLSDEEARAVAWYIHSLGFEEHSAAVDADDPPVEEEADVEAQDETDAALVGEGVISGSITNASGGDVPDDLVIQIRGLEQTADGVNEFLVRQGTVTADGAYLFDNLPFDREAAGYSVSVVYDGLEFGNGVLIDQAEGEAIDLPITVYENTTDPNALVVERASYIVQESPESLSVIQLFQVRNRTDAVYVTEEPVIGGRRGTFAIRVPVDAFNIQFEGGQLGGRFVLGEQNLVYDTALIQPGGDPVSLALTYRLPYDGGRDLAYLQEYETDEFIVLAQGDTPVRSSQLVDEGFQDINGTIYRQYYGEGLSAEDTLIFRVGNAVSTTNALSIILGVVLLVVVIGGVVYGLIFGPRQWDVPDVSDLDTDAATLIAQINALDAAYAEGDMDEFIYEAQRADLKAELAELIE